MWKGISGVLAAIVLLGGAYTAYDQIRPWATRDEHAQVKGKTCKNELDLYRGEIRDIQRDLSLAENAKNTAWANTLSSQMGEVREDVERAAKECGW